MPRLPSTGMLDKEILHNNSTKEMVTVTAQQAIAGGLRAVAGGRGGMKRAARSSEKKKTYEKKSI